MTNDDTFDLLHGTMEENAIWAAPREKVPNVLSRCHTKRRTGARAAPVLILV